MKQIDSSSQSGQWENRLLKDLSFIKKHGRYPISKKTLAPATAILFFIVFIARFSLPLVFLNKAPNLVIALLTGIVVFSFVRIIYGYYNTLVFKKVSTPYYLADNQVSLERFLSSQHLAFSRLESAPEVFMIMSKPITLNTEEREVMVFIADDKRILVNSHFTGRKLAISGSRKHHKQMVLALINWINNTPNDDNSLIKQAK